MTSSGALHGLKVLDMSRVLAGPLAGQVLADLGADVIKIERPVQGDDSRTWAPPYMSAANADLLNESAYFWTCNRGKRSVTAELTMPAGRDLVVQLAREADVLIENYKVGTLARFGLDYDGLSRVNPGLVYCSITGFGQTGPYRERPGYDTIVQAMGGLMSITGDGDDAAGGGPRKSGVAVADQMTGLYATIAILAALQERHASGLGQHIDMALLDVQVAALTNLGTNYLATGRVPGRQGNRLSTVYPSDDFACQDGRLMVIVGNDAQFRRLCGVLAVPHLAADPRFARNTDRLAHADVLAPLIEAAFAGRRLAECEAALSAAGVPAAPINDLAQVFDHPQVRARSLVREVQRADGAKVRLLASPIRMSRSAMQDDRAAPSLGEHTLDIQHGWPTQQETT